MIRIWAPPGLLASVVAAASLFAVSERVFADAQAICASDEQATRVLGFFAENNGLPAIAAGVALLGLLARRRS